MKLNFGIGSEAVAGKPYAVRYTRLPYEPNNQDCKSVQVFAHAKGTVFSPLCVKAVLLKFDILPLEYEEAASHGKLVKMQPQKTSSQ
jgi:hypothetical protein